MFPANVTVFFHNFVETNLSVLFVVLHRIPLTRETIFGPGLHDIETGVGETERGRRGRASLAHGTRRNRRLCFIDAVDSRNHTESICCSRADCVDCAYAVYARTLRGSNARIQKCRRGVKRRSRITRSIFISNIPRASSEIPEKKNRRATQRRDETNLIIELSRFCIIKTRRVNKSANKRGLYVYLYIYLSLLEATCKSRRK